MVKETGIMHLLKRLFPPDTVGYVGGSDRLPPPLGKEEEVSLFRLRHLYRTL